MRGCESVISGFIIIVIVLILGIVALLKLKSKHRMQVAALAIKYVGLVAHGGRKELGARTLKTFAEKIGVNDNTLYE